ncbi:MAG: tyrosine-protein phosphatase [Actinobacteria bacterium]|nr:MAG: tyrosine-protein phosphatase [Actinomycetota bacterium]
MTIRSRELAWEGCLNVRDLGGLTTEDGGETSYGRVIRADSIRQLTDAGWEAVAAYGVRTVVDLRGDYELRDDPPGELPLQVVHVPFMEAGEDEWDAIVPEIEAAAAAAPDATVATRDVYLIFLDHWRHNAAAGVRAVAQAPEGGVVVHCVGGKDRTGLLCAFLLHLAGVGIEDIAADYALSEERLRPRHEQWLAEAETEAERERLRRISRTPAEAMVGVFAELERRHGGATEFMRGSGLSAEELELARARLR